jgi:hypothetical protein
VSRIALQEVVERILLGIKIGALLPGQRVLQVAPDPLDRMQLRAIGRPEDQAYVLWKRARQGLLRATVIPQEDMQTLREGLGQGIEAAWAHVCIEVGPCKEAVVTRGGFDRTIDLEPREDMLYAPDGLDTARREAPAADGQPPKTALVLAQDPDGVPVRWGNHLLEGLMTGALEGRNRLRLFVCDGAEPR